MRPIPANGTKGHLIDVDGKLMFRVYDHKHNYVDYDIWHSDLTVIINDEDAYFYDGEVLDHSPKTLGLEL